MLNPLGYSVYLSTFEQQKDFLCQVSGKDTPVFTSLHIGEEATSSYANKVQQMCDWLNKHGFCIIADVSSQTRVLLGKDSIAELADSLNLWALRIDYGVPEQEIAELAQKHPILLNASTVDVAQAQRLIKNGAQLMAMHNFYPRPETGLDADYLLESTKRLQAIGISVYAFIAGDRRKRGPLHLGLPTLEEHRNLPPLAAFADLAVRFNMDGVFVGDPEISEFQRYQINSYCDTQVLPIPMCIDRWQENLQMTYTCRPDSPASVVRFQESRQYAVQGQRIEPQNCTVRTRGSLTQDNLLYGRYSGEIQLLRQDFPADKRVNVLGAIAPNYDCLLNCIQRGKRFRLVKAP